VEDVEDVHTNVKIMTINLLCVIVNYNLYKNIFYIDYIMLSFNKYKDAIPIAEIDGGNNDGEYLYLYEDSKLPRENIDYGDYINDDMFYDNKKRRQMKAMDMNKIIRALKLNQEVYEDELIDRYSIIKNNINNKVGKEVLLPNGNFQFIPNSKVGDSSRHVLVVIGGSGAGKSYWCADYAKKYKEMFPKNEVYIFSKKTEDKAFDKYKSFKRILLDDSFIAYEPEELLSYKDFSNSLLIFDDVDCIEGEVGKQVMALRSDVLQLGRANNVSCCITTHIVCNGGKTKEMINEATHYVFFRGANKVNTGRLLKNYVGIPEKDTIKLFTLPSRWVIVSKNYPSYVLHSSGAYLL